MEKQEQIEEIKDLLTEQENVYGEIKISNVEYFQYDFSTMRELVMIVSGYINVKEFIDGLYNSGQEEIISEIMEIIHNDALWESNERKIEEIVSMTPNLFDMRFAGVYLDI